jgi:hypothetical protein
VDRGLDGMLLAPYGGCERSGFFADGSCEDLVFARSLDWRHIETQCVPSLNGAANMEVSTTLQTRNTSAVVVLFADLACRLVAFHWDGAESFRPLQKAGFAEFDFRCPYGALNVYPVVAISTLQWLSGVAGSVKTGLLLVVFQLDIVHKLLLQSLLFTLAV